MPWKPWKQLASKMGRQLPHIAEQVSVTSDRTSRGHRCSSLLHRLSFFILTFCLTHPLCPAEPFWSFYFLANRPLSFRGTHTKGIYSLDLQGHSHSTAEVLRERGNPSLPVSWCPRQQFPALAVIPILVILRPTTHLKQRSQEFFKDSW